MSIVDVVVDMLNAIGGYKLGILSETATTPISQASPVAYTAVRGIADTVVRPVASVVLSLMLVVELARNASRFDGDGQMGVRIIAGTMFKFVLLIVAVQYAPEILDALNGIAETIMQGIPNGTQEGAAEQLSLGEQLRSHLNLFNALPVMLLILLPFIISFLALIFAQGIIIFRFIELYLLTAFATLPVAFAAHPDTKSIAVGYLRSYAAVAMQGVTLLLGIYLYQLLVSHGGFNFFADPNQVGNGMSVTQWAIQSIGPLSLSGILLIFVVMGSSRLAKSIVGQGG